MNRNSRDEFAPMQQVRKIGPTRRSVSGVYAFRGERSIEFESTLERDFLMRVEFSQMVVDVAPQPVELRYRADNGREYRYTPDFLVRYRAADCPFGVGPKPLLVEVKPREKLRKHWCEMRPKFKAALRYAREQGWDFRIYDESRIRDQVLANIFFLQRYLRLQFPTEDVRAVLENLSAMGQAPFHYLVGRHFSGIADRAVGVSLLWHLLSTGLMECDMTLPLNNNTVLWTPHHER
ncbi:MULTISPECIES: heteromeric transposase endonuclease subunit TnsA [Ralstonia]|nr:MULTISPECIES: heteromeric transposase endonuclease subunit TnsA [Ralstonia]MCT4983462.1 heteromeric transposase endonuclease subunit TnsA [Pseudomonas aeruginosa]